MFCFASNTTDPYYNLAIEEYLLHSRTEDFFFLWTSQPAVVIGKHQVAVAEINPEFTCLNRILIARRLSGGGTVFHDEGNINFAFITNEEQGKLVNFSRYAVAVMGFLETLGVKAELGGNNDIKTKGLKVSGSAMHVYKNRVLHHGTLLFNANLSMLKQSLAADTRRFTSLAVQSKRTGVINIHEVILHKMTNRDFTSGLFNYIVGRYYGDSFDPGQQEIMSIEELARRKYASWEWIYGYSPDYRFENECRIQEHPVKILMNVKKGIIDDLAVHSVIISTDAGKMLSDHLRGCRHSWEDVEKQIRNRMNKLPEGMRSDEFVKVFF